LDPHFDRALRGLSFCYTKLGRLIEAIDTADSALAIDNKHYRNWQAKGDALLALGKFEEALFTAQTAIDLVDLKTDPEATPVLEVLFLQKFNAYLGLGKTEDAIKELEQARKVIPGAIRFYIYPAQIYLGLGNPKSAKIMLDLARDANLLEMFPPDLRIRILFDADASQDVWEWLDPLMNESFSKSLVDLGYEYYLNKKGDVADNIFTHLHELNQEDPQIATNLAFILTGDGEYKQALSLLEKVLESKETEIMPLALCNIGYIYLATNKIAKAKKCFMEVLSKAGDNDTAVARVGFWKNRAVDICCTPYPVQPLPLKLVANANLVAVHLHEQDIEKAEKLANKIVDQYPDLSLSYQVIGDVQFAKNATESAIEDWKKALSLCKDEAEKGMIKGWLNNLNSGKPETS
jgi:tetratricopeptide (TPR) repeat protein